MCDHHGLRTRLWGTEELWAAAETSGTAGVRGATEASEPCGNIQRRPSVRGRGLAGPGATRREWLPGTRTTAGSALPRDRTAGVWAARAAVRVRAGVRSALLPAAANF